MHSAAIVRLAAGTAAFGAAGLLCVYSGSVTSDSMASPALLEQRSSSTSRHLALQLQMLYAANPPDASPFDDFDRGFKQGKYKKAKTVRPATRPRPAAIAASMRSLFLIVTQQPLLTSATGAPQDKNVFKGFDKGFKQPPYRSLEEQTPDENPFANTPDNYPFDGTEGGHEWKHWDGDSPMDALKEFNALDTGFLRSPFCSSLLVASI